MNQSCGHKSFVVHWRRTVCTEQVHYTLDVIITSITEGGRRLCIHPCLSVCFLICLWTGYLKKLWMDSDKIWWGGWVCDKDEMIRFWWRFGSSYYNFFFMIRHHWEIRQKKIYSTTVQVVDGFGWNLVDMLGVWQVRKIQFWWRYESESGWIGEFFFKFLKWFFNIEKWGQKRNGAWYFKKFRTSFDKTLGKSWLGAKNKLIRFWFRSGSRSDLTVGYKT